MQKNEKIDKKSKKIMSLKKRWTEEDLFPQTTLKKYIAITVHKILYFLAIKN